MLREHCFKGTFRDYQQRVLDKAEHYLKDGKIHVVAAPGSGKTILGLELIRRLNQPTIIFSPSLTIKHQWADRFQSHFLNDSSLTETLISTNLAIIKPITTATYQGLHAAMNKEVSKEDDEYEQITETEDFTKVDLLSQCRAAGVKTVCLDEAHHLRNEWHRALVTFLDQLGKDITIIALTATPPYDANRTEWDKYIGLCGVIDEEIFIPELVAQGTLAPHQDYIVFNQPSGAESAQIAAYRKNAYETVRRILESETMKGILQRLIESYDADWTRILERPEDHVSLSVLAVEAGIRIPRAHVRQLTGRRNLPPFTMALAETGFSFLLEHEEVDPAIESIKTILSKQQLIERGNVRFLDSKDTVRTMIASIGKLASIVRIAKQEHETLRESLRLLILTDFIKREHVKDIGTDHLLPSIGATTIFEAIRRETNQSVPIGILTGSLVILPLSCLETLDKIVKRLMMTYTVKQLTDGVGLMTFQGSNKHIVKAVTELFEQGAIQIIVGTASLLGEGWDSPSINSLILASYVGSFMLSNQMRGRAIRIDPKRPDKVANIWHLVTVDPRIQNPLFGEGYDIRLKEPLAKKTIESADYELLERRFECFMGPMFEQDKIVSGIQRVDYIQPPFDSARFEEFNETSFALAKDRERIRKQWKRSTLEEEGYSIYERAEIKTFAPPTFMTFYHVAREAFLTAAVFLLSAATPRGDGSLDFRTSLFVLGIGLFSTLILAGIHKLFKHVSPTMYLKAIASVIVEALIEDGRIESQKAKAEVTHDEYRIHLRIRLLYASVHDQNVFVQAMSELLSSIDNPRYLIVKRGLFGYRYRISYPAPEFVANNRLAEFMKQRFAKTLDSYELLYTRSEMGRKHLLLAKQRSFLTKNHRQILRRKTFER